MAETNGNNTLFFTRSYQSEISVLSFITIKEFVLLKSCLFRHAMQLLMSVYHCDLVLCFVHYVAAGGLLSTGFAEVKRSLSCNLKGFIP